MKSISTLSLLTALMVAPMVTLHAQYLEDAGPAQAAEACEARSAKASAMSIFFRGHVDLSRGQTADIVDAPTGGFSFGVLQQVGNSRFHVGGSLGATILQSKTWEAPFSSPEVTLAEADHWRSTDMFEIQAIGRLEPFGDMGRIVPYAEAGMGLGMLSSTYEVTMENPNDNCDVWVLQRDVLSRDWVPLGYAGGGAMIMLNRRKNLDFLNHRTYLDLFAGPRTTLGTANYYYGDEWTQRTSPLDFMHLRAGLIFRITCEQCQRGS